MVFFQPRFPTPALRRLELRLRTLLRAQLEAARNKQPWDSPASIRGAIPELLILSKRIYGAYEEWAQEASRQFEAPIQCKKGCSNCCQHYPMSVEPFELISFYAKIRKRSDFAEILEACFRRVQHFSGLQRSADSNLSAEDRENESLHKYFEAGLRCPFLNLEGGCEEHAHRPITCRMYFSFTDPRFCTPEFLLLPENKSFHLCLPDELEEDFAEWQARFEPLGLSESLYEGLLQINTWEQDGAFS